MCVQHGGREALRRAGLQRQRRLVEIPATVITISRTPPGGEVVIPALFLVTGQSCHCTGKGFPPFVSGRKLKSSTTDGN